jgi:Amt family ammonium transporter
MDQRGVNLPLASDPSYKQVGSTAADELVVTFGEAVWDPNTRCAGRVPVFGGHRGHWTYMDQGTDGIPKSDIFETTLTSRLNLEFCFRDHRMDVIDLKNYVKASSLVGAVGFSLPATWDGYVEIPQWIMHLSMVKKPWGWDRVTTILDVERAKLLNAVLPSDLRSWLDLKPYAEAHYPVFQIVDGHGQKTEHWDAYLTWANDPSSWKGYNCTNNAPNNNFGSTSSTFTCPSNHGNGMQLVSRLQAAAK